METQDPSCGYQVAFQHVPFEGFGLEIFERFQGSTHCDGGVRHSSTLEERQKSGNRKSERASRLNGKRISRIEKKAAIPDMEFLTEEELKAMLRD